jgi:HK97 gp10 family phage protein
MTITMKMEGAEAAIRNLRRYGAAAQAEVEKAIVKTAVGIQGHAVQAIQGGPKTGTVYTRSPGQNLSATHRASSPGEAPATDTGRLVSSIIWRMDGSDALVGSSIRNPPYPKFLEFGTVNMAERPFLRPALDANRKPLLDRLREIHKKALL